MVDGSGPSDGRLRFALAAVLAIGFAVRAQIALVPDFMTGDDGAYYLVQVRGVLRDGRLHIPDFPLLFYVQAAIAGLLSYVMDQGDAIVAAVRWTDATIPVLLAVPVYLLVRRFAGDAQNRKVSRSGAVASMLITGIVATASGSALWTAGGAIKNACALPFCLLFLVHLHRALEAGSRGAVALAVSFLLVSSLMHVSALALNASLAVLVALASIFIPGIRRRALRSFIALAASLAAVLGAAFLFDPERATRFFGVLVHPGRFLAGLAVPVPAPAGGIGRLAGALAMPQVWTGNALGLLGAYVVWRYRSAGDATRVILWAATLTTLLFSFPGLAPELLERLSAVAFVPALVPLAFLVCHALESTAVVAPLAALTVLAGALTVKTARVTSLVRPAHAELVRFKASLPPGRIIVIAPPRLEWWAVWTLDTHFSNLAASALARRADYDAVLLLEPTGHGAFGRLPMRLATAVPGGTVRDGALLREEAVTTLAEGRYFRLSRVWESPAEPSRW